MQPVAPEGVGALGCSVAAIPFEFQISPLPWKATSRDVLMYPGAHALTNPDRPALIMTATGEIVTYAELEDRSRRSDLAHPYWTTVGDIGHIDADGYLF